MSSPGGSAGAARRSDTPTTGIEALELDPEPTGRSVAARPAVEGLIEVRDGAGVSDVIPGPAARPPVGGARDDAADARWRRNVVIAVGVTVAVAVVAVVASLAGGRRPVPSRGGGAAQPAAAVAAAPSSSPAALPPPTPAPQRVADAVPVVSAPAEAEVAVEVPPPDRGTSEPSPQRDAVEARPARSSARPARREEPAARKGAPAAKPTSAPARQQVATAKPAVPAAPSPPPQAAPASTAAPSHAAPPQPAPQIASNAPVSRPPAPLPAPVAAPGPTAAAPPAQAPAAQRADDARPGSEDVTKVVLRRDVEGLGRSGEVVEVPPGYARNFLVPKGLAAPAAGKRGRDAQPQRRPDGQGEEEPAFAGAGYRRPAPTTPQCVERNLRLPAEAVGGQPAAVTLRFAVGRTGVADLVDVQPGPGWPAGRRVGPRLVDALNAAVRGCRFTPGADEQGRPVRLWVVMQVPVSG